MIDFLKAHPGVTKDAYLWEWTVPQIQLSICDNTHIEYLTEEQAKQEKIRRSAMRFTGSDMGMLSDLGIPIFGNKLKN